MSLDTTNQQTGAEAGTVEAAQVDMGSIPEQWVIELARQSQMASKYLRGLSPEDRDDILQAAFLYCWANRHEYPLTTTAEVWFAGAVRNAKRAWRRGELRNSPTAVVEIIPISDDTVPSVSALQSIEKLLGAMPPEYRRVLELKAQGFSRSEIEKNHGISKRVIDETMARVKQLRRLQPNDGTFERKVQRLSPELKRKVHTAPERVTAAESEKAPHDYNSDNDTRAPSGIDRELEKLDMPPKHGADCPPCWRCKWFEGFLPGEHRSVRMEVVEPEVREAIARTEARKIAIAEHVRAGTVKEIT